MNINDDPLNEIREIRHIISKEFGHDPKRYIDYLKKIKGDYSAQASAYEELTNEKIPKIRYV